MKSLKIALVALAVVVTGCASNPQKQATKETEQRQEQAAKRVKTIMSDVPDWYLEPPKSEDAIYATATETSRDLQWTIDKANMSAVRTIALKMKSEVSAKVKDYSLDAGLSSDDRVQREIERVSTQTALAVDVSGYSRVKSVVEREDGKFRVYTLVKLPLGEANKAMVENVRKSELLSKQMRQSKAFRELEAEVDAEKGRVTVAPKSEGVTVTPVPDVSTNGQLLKPSQLTSRLGDIISDPEVRAEVQNLYTKPDTVVIQETVR
jgi:PBP1b-binding outer membrane lipoprotein LpoB